MVRVLILDDFPEMGELIALILEAQGYECAVTDDSYEAWALLHTLPFDVLIQDNLRPHLGGVEFYHLVRAEARLASLVVVMVSAVQRLPGSLEEVYDAGLGGYVSKPFRRHELETAIANALHSRDVAPPQPPARARKMTPGVLFRRLKGEHAGSSPASLVESVRAEQPRERVVAARALGRRGDDAAIEPLLGALADTDAGVRGAAAFALGRIGAGAAAEPLVATLRDDDYLVRLMAVRALAAIGRPGIESALVERLDLSLIHI